MKSYINKSQTNWHYKPPNNIAKSKWEATTYMICTTSHTSLGFHSWVYPRHTSHVCAGPKPWPGVPTPNVECGLKWEWVVRFVDIPGIIYHPCLNFVFNNKTDKQAAKLCILYNTSLKNLPTQVYYWSTTNCVRSFTQRQKGFIVISVRQIQHQVDHF
jgi:hypothetical protein